MKQVIFSRTYGDEIGNGTSAPAWAGIRGANRFAADGVNPGAEARSTHPWSAAGTLSNFWAAIYVPILRRSTSFPIFWPDVTLTVKKNGVATALKVTLPAQATGSAGISAVNLTDVLTVAPGDTLVIERDVRPRPDLNGVSAHFLWSISFTPTSDDESCYIGYSNSSTPIPTGGSGITASVTGPWNGTLGFTNGNWNTGASAGNNGEPSQWSIVPCAGNLTRLDVNITDAPGGSATRTFFMQVNGVSQDGTAGTPDTRIVFGPSDTSGSSTFTLPLNVLDYLTLRNTITGTPAHSYATYSSAFRPTTAGQYAYCVQQGNANPSRTMTDWFGCFGGGAESSTPYAPTPPAAPPADGEAFMPMPGGVDPVDLEGFIVALFRSPGAGKSYTVTPRLNLASPGGGPQLVLSDATCVAQTNIGTLHMTSPNDRIDVQTEPSGTPSPVHIGWTFLLVSPVEPPPPPPEAGCPAEGEGCILTLPAC